MRAPRLFTLAIPILLLLTLWASRLAWLEALPLHNDEGLHLTRAVEVWNLHPFWAIGDGKIINHWPIAAFYPQHAPVFVGRAATSLVALLGLAAGWALARRFGQRGALLAGSLWITSAYLFFFERLALSDAEAGALVVLALWFSTRLAGLDRPALTGAQADLVAVLTGLALAAAGLFKFTALPFALSVLVIVGLGSQAAPRRRLRALILIGVVGAACFAVPVAYLLLRGGDLFGIALDWIGGGSGSGAVGSGIGGNLAQLGAQLTGYGLPIVALAVASGLVLLAVLCPRAGGWLLLALALPLLTMIVLGREVLPRHFVVAMPAAITLGGAGLGLALDRLPPRWRPITTGTVIALAALSFLPFAWTAYRQPDALTVPAAVRTQYISDHSAGYGLREAVLAFPQTLSRPELSVVASMFPDSCRRANFYIDADAVSLRGAEGSAMICADAPGLPVIETALNADGAVYVLVETAGVIGADMPALAAEWDAQVERIAAYPRPGESLEDAAVVLWLLTR